MLRHTCSNNLNTGQERCVISRSLKSRNKTALASIVTVNIVLYVALVQGEQFISLVTGGTIETYRGLLLAGAGIVLAGILNAQLSRTAKARIVFLKWTHPLPGSRAFSHYLKADPRIDYRELGRRFGPFPTEPSAQHARWYKLYKSVDESPAVMDAHQEYLFARDYATLMVLLSAILVPASIVIMPSVAGVLIFLTGLLVQFLLAARAARIHAERLVCQVLAIKSAEERARGE